MPRPRSIRAHDAVIAAARTLFAERGIDAASMDAIAAASGVSKATIYKHWPDKETLCLEVLAHLHGHDAVQPEVDTGDVRADLFALLSRQPPKAHADVRARIMPQLMAHAARNPAFGMAWRARVFEPPRLEVVRVLERAMARGDLPGVDLDLATTLLLGPMLYGHIRKLATGKAPADMAAYVVDAFLRSHRAPAPADGAKQPRGARRRGAGTTRA